MCRLKVKVRIIGKKNQEFVRFILVPKNIRQRGKYHATLGYWDTRVNNQTRYVVFNIYGLMTAYRFGALPNKTSLHHIYKYFSRRSFMGGWYYFNDIDVRLFLEDELKQFYKFKQK